MGATPVNDPSSSKQKNTESLNQSIREWLRFGLEVLAFIALVCYVRATQKQVRAANRQAVAAATQAQIARRQFELSERPWVSASNFKMTRPFEFVGNGAVICVDADLRNHGHSVATDVVFRIRLVADIDDIKIQERDVCAELTAKDFEDAASDVVFPDEPISRGGCDLMTQSEIVKSMYIWKKQLKPKNDGGYASVGCLF